MEDTQLVRKFDATLLAQSAALQEQMKGVKKIIVSFDGSNDEGFVEGVRTVPNIDLDETLTRSIEEMCDSILQERHPGWEINDGACGHFIFDLQTRKARLEFHHKTTSYEDDSEDL